MREIRSEHWLCGTEVSEEVADDYDLSEGVALVCPSCQEVWWHYPDAAAQPSDEAPPAKPGDADTPADVGAQTPPQDPSGEATTPTAPPAAPAPAAGDRPPLPRKATHDKPLTGLSDEELTRRSWPGDESRPGTARTPREGPRLARSWILPALGVAVVALVLIKLSDIGFRSTSAPRTTRTSPHARPTGTPPVTVLGPGFTLQRPAKWRNFARGGATVVAPGRQSPVALFVYVSNRPSLSLAHAGVLAANALRAAKPGAVVHGAAPVIGPPGGLRVSATGTGALREMTVLAKGARRYLLDLRVATAATTRQRAQVNAVVRSFKTHA